MKNSILYICLLSAATTIASPLDSRKDQDIQWRPCPEEGPEAAIYATTQIKIECGVLAVPLDWTSPESEAKHNISLVKVPAPKQPAKGSIQFNFGGPGVAGKRGLLPFAEVYQA